MKAYPIFVSAILMLSTIATNVQAREKAGNGGDALASQFSETAKNLLASLKTISDPACSVAKDFESAYSRTVVNSLPFVIGKDGKEKDAINFPDATPDPMITVSRSRFLGIDNLSRVRVVLHEYLSVAGRETSDEYVQSAACVDVLTAMHVDLAQFVPPVIAPTSVIDWFVSSRSTFDCHSPDGTFYEIHLEPTGGCRPVLVLNQIINGRITGSVESLRSCGSGTFGEMNPESASDIRALFKTFYSLESGAFNYQFTHGMNANQVGSRYSMNLYLSSGDMLHWALKLSGDPYKLRGVFGVDELSLSCVPVYQLGK